MRSLFFGMSVVAMSLMACAEQKTVPVGETVTVAGEAIVDWADDDIDIGAGATLCFVDPKNTATFTGKITGSGRFVAKFDSTSERPNVFIMDGDANEFSGAFHYSNVYVHVKSPMAVGNVAPITISMQYAGGTSLRNQFFGSATGQPDFVYKNPLDVSVQINASYLDVGERAELAGVVFHRGGAIKGLGRITGTITTESANLYCSGGLHVDGSVISECSGGTKLTNQSGILHLKGKTQGLHTFNASGRYIPVYFYDDNIFGENVDLQMGFSSDDIDQQSAYIDLNGHSQVFKRPYFSRTVPIERRNIGGIDNTGAPATITFADNSETSWFYGRLDGHLSVTVSGANTLGFVASTNTMNGTVAAVGGKVKLAYYWPKVKNIISRNGGFVEFDPSAYINPKVTIDIDGTSKIKVPNDLNVKVRALRINGVSLPIGKYWCYSPAVSGYFDANGKGTIEVLGDPGFILSFR